LAAQGDGRAHRMTENSGPRDAQAIHKLAHQPSLRRQRIVASGRPLRVAEALQIEGHHAQVLREDGDVVAKVVYTAPQAVDEDEGRALTPIHVVDGRVLQANHLAGLGGIRQVQILTAPDQPASVGPKRRHRTHRQTAQQKEPSPYHTPLARIMKVGALSSLLESERCPAAASPRSGFEQCAARTR
jgi:hypothetical protein